jgi:hypothetical protein
MIYSIIKTVDEWNVIQGSDSEIIFTSSDNKLIFRSDKKFIPGTKVCAHSTTEDTSLKVTTFEIELIEIELSGNFGVGSTIDISTE